MEDDEVAIELQESELDDVISIEPLVVTDYSVHARHVLQAAESTAMSAPGGVLTCEHLLLSLVADSECAAAQVMTTCGFTRESISSTIAFIAGPQPTEELIVPQVTHSPRVERVLAGAGIEAGDRMADRIDTLHLLFALIRERRGIAVTALETPGVGHEMIGAALSSAMRSGMSDPS